MVETYSARYISLHVRVSNKAALRLYRDTLGFTKTETTPKYYADGEDAFLMRLDLVPLREKIDADRLARRGGGKPAEIEADAKPKPSDGEGQQQEQQPTKEEDKDRANGTKDQATDEQHEDEGEPVGDVGRAVDPASEGVDNKATGTAQNGVEEGVQKLAI